MENDKKYIFCPKCGALMDEKEGCRSCGFGTGEQQNQYDPSGKKNTALIAVMIVVAITVLLCVAMFLVFRVVKNILTVTDFSFSAVESSDDSGYEFNDILPEDGIMERIPDSSYQPDAEDEYYETIVNAVRDDLSYSIEWEEFDLYDEETGASASGRYPKLVGENIPNLEALNDEISYNALYYSDLYNYYREEETVIFSFATESIAYVTYMDEEKISIVLDEYFYMNGDSYVSLYSINLDLQTGTLMDNEEILEFGPELAEVFQKQSNYQNGEIPAVTDLSLEEIQELLSDSDSSIIFYTPVGMEIGYNYSGIAGSSGWVTATLKDYVKYVRKI